MNPPAPNVPPPIPAVRFRRRDQILIAWGVLVAGFMCGLLILRVAGLLQPFSIPTGSMTPAISAGDHVLMENMTFLTRKPRLGDVIVFKTDGILMLAPGQIHDKRVAGRPGDHVRISNGNLYINETRVALTNTSGEIVYNPAAAPIITPPTDVIVPAGQYFVLGDNSTNSFDSRYWGFVPRANIIGRLFFCYWPPDRIGAIK
jgi:signal peptidase I